MPCQQRRNWLRHCATSRKVVGSIPDGFNGIFHWGMLSGRTMALVSTRLIAETSIRNTSWGEAGVCIGRRCVVLTALSFSCGGCVEILTTPTFCVPKGLSRPVWDSVTFIPRVLNVFLLQDELTRYEILFLSPLLVIGNWCFWTSPSLDEARHLPSFAHSRRA